MNFNSSDGGFYGVITDGAGNLTSANIVTTNIPKPSRGLYAPDGSRYVTLKDGVGNLIGVNTGYVANAVHFDGSTTLLNDALSNTDNGYLSMSLWFKVSSVSTTTYNWFVSDPSNQYNNFAFIDGNRVGSGLCRIGWLAGDLPFTSFSNYDTADEPNGFPGQDLVGSWHHVMFSTDIDNSQGNKPIVTYVDDVLVANTQMGTIADAGPASTLSINGLKMYLMGDGSGNNFIGDIADVWVGPGVSLLTGTDISETTRREFISSTGKPVDPSGWPASPMQFYGNSTDFPTNNGTGGSFTLTGTLTNASSSPSG